MIEERVEDLAGNVCKKVQYAYDINGNRISERVFSDDNTLSEITTVYDSENRPVSVTDSLGWTTSYFYHYSDHLEKETLDSLGRRKLEVYNPLNRLVALQLFSPEGEQVARSLWSYDGRGNAVLQQETILFNGEEIGDYIIRTTYNGMGEKTAEIEQDSELLTM